ncbi:MAG: ATP-dependent dethiobiotin synthetase BioD [Deltaproteobacteria bacterium]|nr:ATP-dependent dethiobiotin synthetase BioD [Deltaproteobacteria bacterium]
MTTSTFRIVVTGTDTDVGKTVFSAGLVAALGARYWKPIQAGLGSETDSEVVKRLANLESSRVLPEAYRLSMPASPHIAAAHEGLTLDFARVVDALPDPATSGSLVVEGAGGLMVPIDDRHTMIDLFARWKLPVVLCARTSLGTINHTLLSLEALERGRVPVVGVAFFGDGEDDVEATIVARGRVRHLGRLPRLKALDSLSLSRAFADHIDLDSIRRDSEALR